MALTQNQKLYRRGPPAHGGFGYQVAAGEQIWGGGIVALNQKGTLQRVQTAGSVTVVGVASQDYNNTAAAAPSPDYVQVERGWWGLTVPGATPADINEPVYATDDSTLTLTPPIGGIATAGNTGTGAIGSLSETSSAVLGDYQVEMTGATAFSMTDPRGFPLAAGTVGTAYSQGGIGFTLTAGGTAFAAGDSFVVSVGGLQFGTLSGFDKGVTYVRISGS